MNYTAEQILNAIKKYPESRPEDLNYGPWYWTIDRDEKQDFHFWRNENENTFGCVKWFINIPEAPEEVRPRKYPDELPPRSARKYIAHKKFRDEWVILGWGLWATEGEELIDYFIPIPLEEEMNFVEALDKIKDIRVLYESGYATLYIGPRSNEEFIAELAHVHGYDITPRQPEILPCPNPECGRSLFMDYQEDGKHQVYCVECGYRGPLSDTYRGAVTKSNLIAGKGK
jgi:Zn ribbon nucleic-acid-binding protein